MLPILCLQSKVWCRRDTEITVRAGVDSWTSPSSIWQTPLIHLHVAEVARNVIGRENRNHVYTNEVENGPGSVDVTNCNEADVSSSVNLWATKRVYQCPWH